MIKIKKVSKKYGQIEALSGISLEIKSGEAVALIGPNGAGKSTVLKCLLGVLDFSGEIKVEDIDLKKHPKFVKSRMAYVPQEPAFYDMRVVDILGFYRALRNVGAGKVEEILDKVGLTDHRFKLTTALSGGMKQRLSFAVALLSETPIILLDEPTSNLDRESRIEFLELTKILKDEGKTVVFTSHRIDEVFYIADRVVFLDLGKVIREDTPKNLQNNGFYKVKLDLFISENQIDKCKELLIEKGYKLLNSNNHMLSVEVDSPEKIKLIKTLMENDIDIQDFALESQEREMN